MSSARPPEPAPQPGRQPTRAELIARIAASSKDAVVLAEMQRLGFWPADAGKPSLEAALIAREAELMQSLQRLQADLKEKGDPQAALKALREQRKAEARARREAAAQRREQQRHERALQWHAARRSAVHYLGAGVSGGLNDAADRAERLQRHGLPPIASPQALAEAMGISVAELRFLCFHREVARSTHYRRFLLPKKSGGARSISAPMPRLKRAQYWVLDNLLAKVDCHPAAHGFLPGRSIASNAAPHAGQAVVINLDLKDFFPSVRYPRIKGVFRGLGYDERIATLLALLCSENVCDELQVDGERFFVGHAARERVLPQGAPTSPMLTNILCRQLDRRLQGAAHKLGFTYTRYADDLSFSAPPQAAALTGRLLRQVHHILRDEGFTPHPAKQRVMRSGARQEVTGIVVNQQPAVSRAQRRALRASLHRARTHGLAEATWQGRPATKDALVGYAQFIKMVHAPHGAPLLAQAKALPDDRAGGPPNPHPPAASGEGEGEGFRARAARGQAPRRAAGPWWQPAEAPPPVLQRTAAQLKEERLARLRAERSARAAATRVGSGGKSNAADTRAAGGPTAGGRTSAGAGPDDPPMPPLGPVQWLTAAMQFVFLVYLALRLGSPLAFMLGTCWLGFRLLTRRFGWLSFMLPLLVVAMIAAGLQL